MELPFSTEAFFAVMGRYNEAVWPMQWLLYATGVGLAVLAMLESGPVRILSIIPLLWGLVGGSAAWKLGVEQDYGLLAAALLALALVSLPGRRAGDA